MSGPDAIRIELFSKQFDWTARYAGNDNILGKYDYKLTTDNNELALLTSNTIDSSIRIMIEGPSGIRSIQIVLNKRDTILSDSTTSALKADLSRKERLLRLLVQMKNNHSKKLDSYAWDDIIQKDTLVLCKGKEYEFNFRAKDVIHSAYFLHFRAQINTVPGMTTRTKFKPIYTTEEMRKIEKNPKFNYILMCNKICGGAHYKMKMMVVVKSESEYKAWMASKAKETFKDKYLPVAAAPVKPAAPADSTMQVNN